MFDFVEHSRSSRSTRLSSSVHMHETGPMSPSHILACKNIMSVHHSHQQHGTPRRDYPDALLGHEPKRSRCQAFGEPPFDGLETAYSDWFFVTRAYLGHLHQKPRKCWHKQGLTQNEITAAERAAPRTVLSRKLYSALTLLLKGAALFRQRQQKWCWNAGQYYMTDSRAPHPAGWRSCRTPS